MTLPTPPVNTDADHHHIVHDRESALARDPATVPRPQRAVVENSGSVELDAPAVDRPGERGLLGMEELEAGLACNLLGYPTEDVTDGEGGKEHPCLMSEVMDGDEGQLHDLVIPKDWMRNRVQKCLWLASGATDGRYGGRQ